MNTEKAISSQLAASHVVYYPINESLARQAKDANSFSNYVPGSATAEYKRYVDEAVQIAQQQKKRVAPEYHEKIDRLLDTYARRLAENMNAGYSIDARCPSILIAGGSNFPVRKKEKQNAARNRNISEWRDIQGLVDKIRSTGMGGISADNPHAVERLQNKLSRLEEAQAAMKAVNAYYKKHRTLDGCPHLSAEEIEKQKASMETGWRAEDKPFPSWQLSNNNAEIRRVKNRIQTLTRQQEKGYVGWQFDGGTVKANAGANRLQIFFDNKPDAQVREALKGHGFRWSPNAGAWQRQLNDNAIYACNALHCIRPVSGDKPTELQRKTWAAESTKAGSAPG